jgi:hypothetical protein
VGRISERPDEEARGSGTNEAPLTGLDEIPGGAMEDHAMSVPFPSRDFFAALQESLNADPACTGHLPGNEAYCGFAIDEQLFVLEFEGHECSAVVSGGNELDLDFVVAGPAEVWRGAIEAVEDQKDVLGLPKLVKSGALEIRSLGDDGLEMARETLPFLQVFLEHSRGLEVQFI